MSDFYPSFPHFTSVDDREYGPRQTCHVGLKLGHQFRREVSLESCDANFRENVQDAISERTVKFVLAPSRQSNRKTPSEDCAARERYH
jgi:hypothetical protein